MTMSPATQVHPAVYLDYAVLTRAFACFAMALILVCPLSPDPGAFAIGACIPCLVLYIIGTPTMPAPVAYFLLWQWLQTFARVLVGIVDETPMERSVFGPSVEDAYWYMMASIVMLALAFRTALNSLRPPSEASRTHHMRWRPVDVFQVYIAAFGLSVFSSYAVTVVPALYQQLDTVAKFKFAAQFLLFANVLSTGQGYRFMAAAVGLELITGFSGLLGDFRGVFIVVAVTALAIRIRMPPAIGFAIAGWAVALIVLGLFWTSVKTDYRDFATGYSETQALTASFGDRIGYIGQKAVSVDEIDFDDSFYTLLSRLAYVDIFGSVVGVADTIPNPESMKQWEDAFSHVFQPRILFPMKAALSDTEVYLRLTRAEPTEVVRSTTSISVGYMAENYADLEFPGMLVGIFAIGFTMGAVIRFFMTSAVPWTVREATVMAFIYTVGSNGVEVSLPKLFGAAVMFFVIYAVLVKFVYPIGLRWLDARLAQVRGQRRNAQRASAAVRSVRR